VCTLALYFGMFDGYPLIVAANRDEYFERPSAPPAVLNTNPLIAGGKDLKAGGTWLGVSENGLLVGILNRRSETETAATNTLRSRGLLCLDLLATSRALLKKQDGRRHQTFNLVVADAKEAYVAYNLGQDIRTIDLETGLHVISNTAIYDARSEKMDRAYSLFSQASRNLRPEASDIDVSVSVLHNLLSSHSTSDGGRTRSKEAICVHAGAYGTVSSSIIFYSRPENHFRTFFAPGPPCHARFAESLTVDVL
jgi:uncharacterized protein with NRDE domain